MKKLGIVVFLFLLTACFHVTWNDKVPDQSVPRAIAIGTDGDLNWRCELITLTDSLAWAQCDFINKTIGWAYVQNCIRVNFYSESTKRLVAESERVCSGLLQYNQTSTKYVAFRDQSRKTMEKLCGKQLNSCVMLAEVEK